jgi:hypothetical protein
MPLTFVPKEWGAQKYAVWAVLREASGMGVPTATVPWSQTSGATSNQLHTQKKKSDIKKDYCGAAVYPI